MWADDGSRSAAAWAAARTGSPNRALKAQVRAGQAQRALPTAAAPAREGLLSSDHLGVLAACVSQHPELAARDEDALVGQALELDADAFRAAGRHWRHQAADLPETEPASEVHLRQRPHGCWDLKGLLNPRDGAILNAALDKSVDRQLRAQRDGDPSVGPLAAQMRAEALVDLAAQEQRAEPGRPTVPDRHRVGIVVRLDDIDQMAEEACDSTFYRIITGADGEVLDIGRDSRRWPKGIRRAITYRDGGCVFPNCDRPANWTDVHHCHDWETGGETKVENGALLCRMHHTFIHKNNWTVKVEQGRPTVYRDDGTEHVITRWQAA